MRLSPRAYLAERRAVRDVCRAFQPDVVHTHGYRIDVVERGVAARLGIPTVTTVHGPSMVGGAKGAIYEWIQRRNYRRFDAVVAVSAALHKTTLADGVRPERLHLVPNAWGGLQSPLSRAEARRLLGLDEATPVLGWVGRMIPVKGGDVFLDAMRLLPEPRPIAVMIGHGSEEEALRRSAQRWGIGEAVRFYPHITDAGRYFAAFDAFVLSSRSEGLPVVLLEAMAAGVPIIATSVGGVPEVVGEGEAVLVPSEDADALAAGIRVMFDDPASTHRRVASATERLRTSFAFDPWLERYEKVYRRVIGGKAR
jgi:glycosyltransferase involved in cell wall biosynthesis